MKKQIYKEVSVLFGMVVIVILLSFSSFAYEMKAPNETVHQHITKEAGEIWEDVPSEIMSHLTQPIDEEDLDGSYSKNKDDDIITGSVSGDIIFDIPKGVTPVTAVLHDSAFSGGVKVNLQ